jgi:hypothetical protein
MKQLRKAGRPREWVLNEEIVEIHRLITELKMQNPKAHWSDVERMLKIQLEQQERKDLLSKFDKLCGLAKQVIPFPPRCICGRRVYSYTHRVEKENEHSWEILARCVNPNCRYERRYLPSAITHKWSRPKPASRELPPTNYEMDGQLVEKPK